MSNTNTKQIRDSLQSMYPDWNVRQCGAKALFVLTRGEDRMLFSYYTIIGRKSGSEPWRITLERFSKTTTAHCSWFTRQCTITPVRVSEIV